MFPIQISSQSRKPLPQTGQCAVKHPLQYSFDISTGLFFVLPMTLILTLYFLIGLQLRRSSRSMTRNCSRTFGKSSLESDTTSGKGNNMIESGTGEGARRGSRTFSSNGMQQHRQNAASRRAVIKMLGKLDTISIQSQTFQFRSFSYIIPSFLPLLTPLFIPYSSIHSFLPPLHTRIIQASFRMDHTTNFPTLTDHMRTVGKGFEWRWNWGGNRDILSWNFSCCTNYYIFGGGKEDEY